ncbi:MAG: hypothetical protein AAB706_00735 [Patescibacteria group bacterium]
MFQFASDRLKEIQSVGERISLLIKDKEGKLVTLSAGDRIAFRITDGAFSLFRGGDASPVGFGCTQDGRLSLLMDRPSALEAFNIAEVIARRFNLHLKPDPFCRRENPFYFTFMLV